MAGPRCTAVATLALLLTGAGLTGCSEEALNAAEDRTCSLTTSSLTLEPSRIVRDDAVELVITWVADESFAAPVTATLNAGADGAIEVMVPLTSSDEQTWRGQVLNPFGAGAPAGDGWLLGQAHAPSACLGSATATLAFTLE